MPQYKSPDADLVQRASAMKRIQTATLGEVILLTTNHHELLGSLMRDFGHADEVLFHGMIGIYDGVKTSYPFSFIRVGDEEVKVELNPKHVYELALIEQAGLVVPFLRIPMQGNAMTLEDKAYIGPEEISAVLREKCGKNFEKFFADYARVHRKVENQETW